MRCAPDSHRGYSDGHLYSTLRTVFEVPGPIQNLGGASHEYECSYKRGQGYQLEANAGTVIPAADNLRRLS